MTKTILKLLLLILVLLSIFISGCLTTSEGPATSIQKKENSQPIAAISVNPASISEGEIISFNGLGSKDLDGNIVSYQWDFGDGDYASDASASHTYTRSGIYTILLTVTDNNGAKATDSIKIEVNSIQTPLQATPTSTPEIADFEISVSSNYDTPISIESYQSDYGSTVPDHMIDNFCCAYKGTSGVGYSVPCFYINIVNSGNVRIKNIKTSIQANLFSPGNSPAWVSTSPNFLFSYFFNPNQAVLDNNPNTYNADEVLSLEPMGSVGRVVTLQSSDLGEGIHKFVVDVYIYSQEPALSWHKRVYYVIENDG